MPKIAASSPRVGIVIPTLGSRPEYLANSISSIRRAGNAHVLIVGPASLESQAKKLGADSFALDPGSGLVAAINLGFDSLPEGIEFANWLGDDDELSEGSLELARSALDKDSKAPFAFGACGYIDEVGKLLWTNNSGKWAIPLLRVGPDLVPQPGALVRIQSLRKVLPLRADYKFAFDFDMFIRLSKLGRPVYVPNVLANFRWHSDSLTVSQRKLSANEASLVRKSHLPSALRLISELWEAPVRFATNVLGARLLRKRAQALN